tara:strand:+ start:414 stop:2060 length:1647 start_codon:yes stop_codon:yes gene_type:complete
MRGMPKYLIVVLAVFLFIPAFSVQAHQFEIKDDRVQFFDKPVTEGRIVYSVIPEGKDHPDLWIMNADGSNNRPLTDTGYAEIHPAISPDGEYVAFSHDREGEWRIAIMSIDNPGPNDPWPITFYNNQRFPYWGENGLIAFHSDQEGVWSIWSKDPFMKGDLYGKDLREVSKTIQNDGKAVENNLGKPSYSNDGKYLAYSKDKGPNPGKERRLWVLNRQDNTSWQITRELSDAAKFYKGENWYPEANRLPVVVYVHFDQGRPNIRWVTVDGTKGGKLTDRTKCGPACEMKDPKFGPARSQEVLAYLENTGPEYWQIGMMDIHRGIGMPTYFITGGKNHPQSIGSVLSFDWGPNPEKNTRSQSQGTKINPGGTKNNMDDFDEERRIKQNELENEMRRLEEEQRRKRQEMDMELQKRQDLTREEENRLRREVDMEMERERMEMERERMEMDMEMRMEMDKMERERMEQQREMMREMDGSGGRDDFFQPDEKCFVEDEEEGRGLFGNISIGSEVNCNETEGMQQRLSDPTTLAMLGLVVTVGATMLQMFRGN